MTDNFNAELPSWWVERYQQLQLAAVEDNITIDQNSINIFNQFLVNNDQIKRPAVGLTNIGVVSAVWLFPLQRLSIRFQSLDSIEYTLISRYSNTDASAGLIDTVKLSEIAQVFSLIEQVDFSDNRLPKMAVEIV